MTNYSPHSYTELVIETESAELLRWCVFTTGSTAVVTLAGEMDASNAPALRTALDEVFDTAPAGITLDLTHLSFLDCSGIRCLVDAAARASDDGCRLTVLHPTATVRRVIELTGAAALLPLSRPTTESH